MPAPCPYLFVYGSLRRGGDAEGRAPLAADGRYLRAGSIPGRLYLAGGWPAAVADPDGPDRVHGEVWELGHPEGTLAALDAWEGGGYRRTLLPVRMEAQGFEVECWAWLWTGPVDEAARIPDGRWRPPQTDGTDERSQTKP